MNRTKYPKANYKRKYNNAKYQRKYRKRKALKGKYSNEKISCSSERLTYMVSRQLPFPPRYRTKMTIDLYGTIPANFFSGGVSNGRATIALNSPYKPFNNGTWVGSPATGPFIVTSVVTPTNLQPAAFSQICNVQFYQQYRVYSSKLSIIMNPEDARDYVELVITPSDSSGGTPGSASVAMALPYTKKQLVIPGKGQVSLKNYMSVHRLEGVTKQSIENDLSGSFTGLYNALPSSLQNWVINIGRPNLTPLNSPIDYQMSVTYWVEFWNLSTDSFAVT